MMNSLPRRSIIGLVGGSSLLSARSASASTSNPAPATAAGESSRGPGGLSWGCSADDVRKLGCSLELKPEITNFGTTYVTTRLPKMLSDAHFFYLYFGYSDRLICVTVVGDVIAGDWLGLAVTDRYEDLFKSLSEIYGPGKDVDRRPKDLLALGYIGAIHDGKAERFADFKTDTVQIKLNISVRCGILPYYRIRYSSKTEEERFFVERNIHDKEAL